MSPNIKIRSGMVFSEQLLLLQIKVHKLKDWAVPNSLENVKATLAVLKLNLIW